jgi:phosphotransferase system enzyme I (PtsI)
MLTANKEIHFMVIHGIAVSEGIAVGPIFVYKPARTRVQKSFCTEEEIDAELKHYAAVCCAAQKELQELAETLASHDREKAKIFTAHQDILADVAITEEIHKAIRDTRCRGDWAIQSVYEKFIGMLSQVTDPLIQERAADLKDVQQRLLRLWNGSSVKDLSSLSHPVVVAAQDLLPSDTASLNRSKILAILTEIGGPTSHSAIIARSYNIPAVLGIGGLLSKVSSGQIAAVDARAGAGIVTLDPGAETEEEYEHIRLELKNKAEIARTFLDREGFTADGTKIEIGLNITSAGAGECESMHYVDYVGLFRTEFLYMGRSTLPEEEEQFQIYKKVLKQMGKRPVTLRTLDIGGDKTTDCLILPKEDNPFLGRRALRLCFSMPELFRTQLRAALRASVYGNLWIMFPMVSSLEDFRKAKGILNEVHEELSNEGIWRDIIEVQRANTPKSDRIKRDKEGVLCEGMIRDSRKRQ